MHKKIVFTGGGTAGHVTPNLALMTALNQNDVSLFYIGSPNSIEETLVKEASFPFYSVSSGKLRRYFSFKNFIDPFKILWGIISSYRFLGKIKPNVVFSKGGFVAVPVVIAAWLRGIPVVAHESDITAGLANKLTFPFVTKVCVTFEQGKKQFSNASKVEVTGTPIRQELFEGQKQKGLDLCGFNNQKPCVLVMGGSLGAARINEVIRECLTDLLQKYQIIHICGKDKTDANLSHLKGYKQFEYVKDELPDLLAASTLVVSRAGANSLYELLVLNIPHVLVPLSKKVSRGDQIENAKHFSGLGVSVVLDDDTFDATALKESIDQVFMHKDEYAHKIRSLNIKPGTQHVIELIQKYD